jgi:hypothetical protein
MICSFTAAVTGIFLASRMGMGDPLVGERYILDSILPVIPVKRDLQVINTTFEVRFDRQIAFAENLHDSKIGK